MPKQKIENLMTHLHETFGDDLTSSQQQQLMQQMQSHLHNMNEEEPLEPGFQETAELLLEEVEEQHPKAAAIVKEIVEVLGNIGI